MSSIPISSMLNNGDQPKFTENERSYYVQWYNTYPYPCDDAERDRLDAVHEALYAAALGDRLHLATLRTGRLRILDIGYGTGKWAIQMKGRYPQAEVIAIDIGNYPVDEYDRPVNFGVEFRPGVNFLTDDWGFENGSGQAEFVELDWRPRFEGETPASWSDVGRWWQLMEMASDGFGKPLAYPAEIGTIIRQAGCNVLEQKQIEVWATEDHWEQNALTPRNRLTRWYRYSMFSPVFKTLKGMSMALLTHQLHLPPDDVAALCLRVHHALNLSDSPYYHDLHVITFRRRAG
ncbi:hypothetical protein LTR10_010846 [Elasticomyces elasticus]|nr:hypothetical protein LTR10_010846 [Elasticomyces elasticus]KAK4968452.1 hypothetical protein LTR42_009735 [Elasticomyces elasticus]